jgi:predicted O-methyltransferase YrrM
MLDIAYLKEKVKKHTLVPQQFLTKFYFLNDSHRLNFANTDPAYTPIYYYLGKAMKAKKVMQFGVADGIAGACFLLGNGEVEDYFAFDVENVFPRLVKRNIHSVLKKSFALYIGKVEDEEFEKYFLQHEWDCILVTGEYSKELYSKILYIAWQRMRLGSWLVCDHVRTNDEIAKVYSTFCQINNRDELKLKTRYGMGLIEK